MSEALRFNSDKPMMSYFMRSFPKMAEAVARVKEMGTIKYNDGNWRLGNKPDKEYWDSMFRHLNYIFDGEFYDSDTGCLHIAHAVWNLCALLELNYPDLPARDEAIWADRAEHWAKEKQKREAKETQEKVKSTGNDVLVDVEFGVDLQDSTSYIGLFDEPVNIDITYSPWFAEYVDKITTRDDEVRVQYEAHCAEEKRERETSDEVPGKFKTYHAANLAEEAKIEWAIAQKVWYQEADDAADEIDAADAAIMAADAADANDANDALADAADAVAYASFAAETLMSKPHVDECPACGYGDDFKWVDGWGMECTACGEIFEVPIVAETEEFIGSGPESIEFVIKGDGFSPVFSAFVNKLATRDDEVRSQHAEHIARLKKWREQNGPAEEKWQQKTFYNLVARLKKWCELNEPAEAANDTADADAYTVFAVESWHMSHVEECPMCGSTSVWQGDHGRECRECGEIFGVPIVPENTPLLKDVKFTIRDVKPSQAFRDMMNRIFKTLGAN